MAHKVEFTVPARPVGNAALEFSVQNDEGHFGRLKVSRGGIEWIPMYKQYGYRLNWRKLDQIAAEYGGQPKGK